MRGPAPAAAPVEKRFEKWVRSQALTVPGDRVVLAVSGGSDSLALLHLFAAMAEGWGLQLAVAHFDHGWRDSSRGDADWVKNRAAELGLPFFGGRAASNAPNTEAQARAARYTFLEDAAARFGGSSRPVRLATGHTADDQAETVLLRLLRGTGNTGLAGILPMRPSGKAGVVIVRPLLWARRAELRTWLQSRGLSWREDATNQDLHHRRNWVRHRLLPHMAEASPKIVERLATLAKLAAEEELYWAERTEDLISSLWRPQGNVWSASTRDLASLDRASLRRLLREMIRRIQGDLRKVDFAAIENVVDWIGAKRNGGPAQTPAPAEATHTRPRLRSIGRCRCRVASAWVEISPMASTKPGAGV